MGVTAHRLDPVIYPESDHMGEHELQRFITEMLRPLVERWLRVQKRIAHAGADQFFYWVQGDPRHTRAPDVYVVDGVPQDIPAVPVWKVWEGHRPDFALEICGDDWHKDYDEAPADYAAMGTRELVIFDPGATPRSRRRVCWQVFRQVRGRGLVNVESTKGDRVFSQWLGVWVRRVEERGHPRLRLATGDAGDNIVPTEAEAERAAKEAEREAKEVALAEVARLRSALEQLNARRRR